jgi:O-methyltransferase
MDCRVAYLDVLKLALCDLVSPHGTTSASRGDDGTTELSIFLADNLWIRREGRDWPLFAVTMCGLDRLKDLQGCVETIVADGVEGDLIEAGAWRGGASILMRATLNSLDEGRTVWVADSFNGFQASDGPFEEYLSRYEILSASLDHVRQNFSHYGLEDGINFVPGQFEDTLPRLKDQRWAIIRLDGDTYDTMQVSLQSLYDGLSPGGFVIVDDYQILPECRRAVAEFRAERGITDPIVEVDWNFARWRRS